MGVSDDKSQESMVLRIRQLPPNYQAKILAHIETLSGLEINSACYRVALQELRAETELILSLLEKRSPAEP